MKAIIVAGGKGERLRPFTNILPKPMIDVNGKPVLEHIINHLKKQGISEFIISVCYLPEKITEYFGNGDKLDVSIEYLYEDENKPFGTAGSIASAKKLMKNSFIVTSGDILRDLDISMMIKFHKAKQAFATLNIHKRYEENPKSMIIFDENKKITSFIERPKPDLLTDEYVWANGSFYIFEPEIFNFLPEDTPKDFGKDVFPETLAQKKALFAYPSDGYFIDIGDENKLEKARKTYQS